MMAIREINEKQQNMDVKTPMPKQRSLKRNVPQEVGVEMGSLQSQKKTKVQEEEKEVEVTI